MGPGKLSKPYVGGHDTAAVARFCRYVDSVARASSTPLHLIARRPLFVARPDRGGWRLAWATLRFRLAAMATSDNSLSGRRGEGMMGDEFKAMLNGVDDEIR